MQKLHRMHTFVSVWSNSIFCLRLQPHHDRQPYARKESFAPCAPCQPICRSTLLHCKHAWTMRGLLGRWMTSHLATHIGKTKIPNEMMREEVQECRFSGFQSHQIRWGVATMATLKMFRLVWSAPGPVEVFHVEEIESSEDVWPYLWPSKGCFNAGILPGQLQCRLWSRTANGFHATIS